MTLWGTVSAAQTASELIAEPVDLSVDYGDDQLAKTGCITDGIRSLYQKCQFYDLLIVGGGSRFPAHQVVLASLSERFRERLRKSLEEFDRPREFDAGNNSAATTSAQQSTASTDTATATTEAPAAESQVEAATNQDSTKRRYPELILPNVTELESVPALLDFVYGLGKSYNITSDEANRDVLQIAKDFELPRLVDLATHRLGQDLTTDNAVQRMVTCEDFELTEMFNKISDELVGNAKALLEVSNNMDLLKHPTLLQKMLVRAASRYASGQESEEEDSQCRRGKRRKVQVEDKLNIVKGGA